MVAGIEIEGKEYSPEEVAVLAKAGVIQIGQKHDTSSTTPTASPLHGPFPGDNTKFGIFSNAGARPGMWAYIPRMRGIGNLIPMFKSVYMNELIDVATGVTAGAGTNQTSACIVGPKPGQLKKAQLAATFGIIHESTKIFDVTQAGMRRNRADVDREFFNMSRADNKWLPDIPGMDGAGIVNSALRTEGLALAIEIERNVNKVHYVGVAGTENNTYLSVARQWAGLDRWVRSDFTDNVSGLAVPSLASAVTAYNTTVGGTDSFGRNIVQAIIDTYYGQIDMNMKLGITPTYVLAMRPDLFRALAAVWSCSFATTRCQTGTVGSPVVQDATAIRLLYEDMIANFYLPMEGTNVQVVTDDAILREGLGVNYYKSDIYGIALTGNGRPVFYGEYFDMANAEAEEITSAFGTAASGETTTLNDGLYRVFKRVTGGCYEYDFFARPRLIHDAPFMNFRIDDVFYNAYYRQTDATPGDSFLRNGGATYLT